VGEVGDPVRDELLATSQATYVPSKVLVAIDPVQEAPLLDRRGLPRRSRPTAFVGIERAYVGEATDSEALARMMIEGEGRRR